MKILAAILILVASAFAQYGGDKSDTIPSSAGPLAFGQASTYTNGVVNPVVTPFVGNTTTGHALIVCGYWGFPIATAQTGNSLTGVSISPGSATFTIQSATLKTTSDATYSEMGIECATANNIIGGTTPSVSCTFAYISGALANNCQAFEISGSSTSSYDQANTATGSSTAISAGNITTATGSFAVASGIIDDTLGTGSKCTAGSGWTILNNSGAFNAEYCNEYRQASGTITGNITSAFTGAWVASVVDIKP